MTTYRLAINGDDLERQYWYLFIKDHFPSYETFWLKFVVPLTNRPVNIHFKNNLELKRIGKSESDIRIAQLSYSIFRHLIRCFEIKKLIDNSDCVNQSDLILEGMTRLVGCYDISFELTDSLANPNEYKAFDIWSSRKAVKRRKKIKKDTFVESIRQYRNQLVHGRMLPGIPWEGKLCLPDIGKEPEYLDWRKITDLNDPKREKYKKDFPSISTIFNKAWQYTLNYLDNNWKNL